MVHELKVYEFTCFMTDVLPSTQKKWKVLEESEAGYSKKALEQLCRAGQPFMIVGRLSEEHQDNTLFNTSIVYTSDGYYITLHGQYINSARSAISTADILLLYDPVLKVLKGRRP